MSSPEYQAVKACADRVVRLAQSIATEVVYDWAERDQIDKLSEEARVYYQREFEAQLRRLVREHATDMSPESIEWLQRVYLPLQNEVYQSAAQMTRTISVKVETRYGIQYKVDKDQWKDQYASPITEKDRRDRAIAYLRQDWPEREFRETTVITKTETVTEIRVEK